MSERVAEALINSVTETVQAAAAGAPSFDEAFTLHHRAVFRAAYALVRDSGLAEDVTQEVFLKLYQHMGSLQNEEHVRPWLLRVASNTALNTIRSRGRAGAREEEFGASAVVGSEPPTVAANANPSSRAPARPRLRMVLSAVFDATRSSHGRTCSSFLSEPMCW